jgi:hypothetical protein
LEKILEHLSVGTQYKIELKSKSTPVYVYIDDNDSSFLYGHLQDSTLYIVAIDDILTIIPSKNSILPGGRTQ